MIGRKQRYALSVLSGVMLVLAFPHTGSLFPLSFLALAPLLLVEEVVYQQKYKPTKVLLHAYITFLIYNIGATYWIYYSIGGEVGAILAYLLNGFLMALVFLLFHLTKRHVGVKEGYISILFYWVGFEYIHYHWELSWPWINFGNIFARVPEIVQWYEYTGILGGTLWVLLANLIFYKIAANIFLKKETWKVQTPFIYLFLVVVGLPILSSIWTYSSYKEVEDPIEVVVTQPNVDPYHEKFTGGVEEQVVRFLNLADELVTPNTQFVLAPETAISSSFDESRFVGTAIYNLIKDRLKKWNGPALFVGASTHAYFDEWNSRASRKLIKGDGYYESYNSSVLLEATNPPQIVHKSKLVLGVEKVPFSHIFPWMEELSIDNGGTSGTLGIEDEPKILKANGITFAPIICYESVYGGFIAEQCRKGAEVIFIITNDGWWENTAGHKQHQSIARLRAIETRRSVARSANTGISSFINQRGDVLQSTAYWEPAVIKETLNLQKEPSFYVTYGDVIGRSFSFVFALLVVFTGVKYLRKFGKSY